VVAIPWQDIIAKSIPSGLRGRFFATIQFASALGAVGAGFAVRRMLGPAGPGFPLDFALLFTTVAVFLSISTYLCAITREPIRPVLEQPESLREIITQVKPFLRARPEFRALILVALLGAGMSWTTPFYIVYATRELTVPPQLAGIYIWAGVLGGAGASLIWGHCNDRFGPLSVIRGGCALVVTTPLTAVFLPLGLRAIAPLSPAATSVLPYLLALVFLSGGATPGAFWMGITNYLFELADHQQRPRYIALLNFLSLPGALFPLLIGWLLNFLPYALVFGFIAASGLTASIFSRRMPAWPAGRGSSSSPPSLSP
jgi:Na+/melibiose symporter-like transporter